MSTDEQALKLKVKQEDITANNTLKQIEAFVIYDQAGYDLAARVLLDVKSRWGTIEAERVAITQPLNQALKNVQKLFKGPLSAYARAEELLKQKMVDAERRAAESQQVAMQAAQQAHQLGDRAAVAVATHYVHQADLVTPEGIQKRELWTYEVMDAALVPREFLEINHTALRSFVTATKGTVQIAGVRVYQELNIAGARS